MLDEALHLLHFQTDATLHRVFALVSRYELQSPELAQARSSVRRTAFGQIE